jgi:Protein of unknown function (DUF2891)
MLTAAIASQLAHIALGHVAREWPNKLDHVMAGEADVRRPSALHPIFYGSFDWHSCVHSYWLLARLYRRFPQIAQASQIGSLFDAQFVPEKVAAECAYLARAQSRGFERPYGWAWALMLSGELGRHESEEGGRWSRALQPLADAFVNRFEEFLPLADYPMRAGVHSNTAFALALSLRYADAAGDRDFAALVKAKSRAWYERDADCQAWEPSLDEFLSPALMEAALMRAVLADDEFCAWFARFLPRAAHGEPATLFIPARVSDRSDGRIAHLDGLNLARAWCWRLIVADLPANDPLAIRAQAAIADHLAAAQPHLSGDYMGEHWLASFAALALDAV